MPYFITDQHPDCENWALVKEDGELIFCHPNEPAARNHMIAISLSEDLEPGGTYQGESFRAALPGDKYTTEQEALDRAAELGCEGTHTMDEDGKTIYMPCSTHGRYEELTGTQGGYSRAHEPGHPSGESEPAPPEDQIEGSDENKPGSASGAGNNIEVSERTETALRNKVKEHNEAMQDGDRPNYTRTTLGQLKAVYRRGAGAYSQSHRPGVPRSAWAMARVNAFLYLLRNGNPENSKYVTDNDLLPEGHPKSTRSDGSVSSWERRDVDLEAPAYMRAAARKGIELYEEGLAGEGVTEQTIREARAMARGNITADKWSRMGPWIARHLTDLDAESNKPGGEGFPGPGAVAFYLWGARPTKNGADRTRDYAESITRRIEIEAEGRATGKAMSKFETRVQATDFEVRDDGDGMTFVGYAAIFDAPSEGLPFTERIQPGAFRRSLTSRNNIFMFYNHDPANILASTRAGTLNLQEDSRGLKVEARLANTTIGRDVAELIRSKNLDSMSFGFSVPEGGDSWNTDGTERTLRSVRLGEVSIVARPAYPSTSGTATVRGLDAIAKRAAVDPDALADALTKIEVGEEITAEDKQIISSVITELAPNEEQETEPESEADTMARLEMKKKKLMAMMKELQ